MQAYKFDTQISENGIIALPYAMPNLYGKEVELFIVVPQQEKRLTPLRNEEAKSDFQRFILSGPVMSDSQYQNFKQQREEFNSWRTL